MKKEISYTYLGTNGILTTPIHLEGIFSMKKITLTADPGKKISKDGKIFVTSVTLSGDSEDLDKYFEVDNTD